MRARLLQKNDIDGGVFFSLAIGYAIEMLDIFKRKSKLKNNSKFLVFTWKLRVFFFRDKIL